MLNSTNDNFNIIYKTDAKILLLLKGHYLKGNKL